MKIPKKLQIAGKEIDIIFDNKRCDDKEIYGESRYMDGCILLQDEVGGVKRKDDFLNVTFLHEVFHWIFQIMNADNFRNDEKLVNDLSEFMYQVIRQIEE